MATIWKGDLAMRVSHKLGVSRAGGDAAVNAVLDSIVEAVVAGDRVVLTGFGSFEPREAKARQIVAVRGPQAGRRIDIPSHRRVGFKTGASLAGAVRR